MSVIGSGQWNEGGGWTNRPWPGGTGGGLSVRKSASYGRPYQIAYGTCAVTGIPVWFKGLGDGYYNPAGTTKVTMKGAEVQYVLGFGPVTAVDFVIYNKRLYGAAGAGGLSLNYLGPFADVTWVPVPPEFTLGDGTTTTWSPYLYDSDPAHRICWPSLSIMRARYFPVEGSYSTVPEVVAVGRWHGATHANTKRSAGSSWTRYDAAPGDVLRDLLENAVYGLGLPAGTLITATGQDGLAASSYDRYCEQMGWWIALAIEDDAQIADIVDQVLKATNSVLVKSGAYYRVVPLGDSAVGTFAPVATAVAITDDEYVEDGQDAIKVTQQSWVDTYSVVPVEYAQDTALRDAELVTTEAMESAAVATFGVRRAPSAVSLPCIRSEAHAVEISGILARRSCWHRSRYEFRVTARVGAGLEVADLVSLTHSAAGLSSQLARVEEIEARPDGTYAVWAREWVTGSSVAVTAVPDGPSGLGQNPVPGYDAWAQSASAITTLGNIAADGVLSAGGEKRAVLSQIQALVSQHSDLTGRFGAYSTVLWTTYFSSDSFGPYCIYGTAGSRMEYVALQAAIASDPHQPDTSPTYWKALGSYLLNYDSAWVACQAAWTDLQSYYGATLGLTLTDRIPVWTSGHWIWTVVPGNEAAWIVSDTTIDPTVFRQKFSDYLQLRDAAYAALEARLFARAQAHGEASIRPATASALGQVKVGSGLSVAADGTLSSTAGGGTVTSITFSSPLTGGTITGSGTVGISAATTSVAGSMSAADKTKLDGSTSSNTAGVIVMRDGSGWIYATDVSTSSDRRTKKKIRTLRGALARVLGLRGVSFVRRGDRSNAPRIGFVAQEVRETLPEVVTEDANGQLAVTYGPVVALIVEALREIVRRLDRLEGKR